MNCWALTAIFFGVIVLSNWPMNGHVFFVFPSSLFGIIAWISIIFEIPDGITLDPLFIIKIVPDTTKLYSYCPPFQVN